MDVVIPAFNEEESLATFLPELREALGELVSRKVLGSWRIIVVDDGSDDATQSVARVHGADVVRLRRNKGKSLALNVGLGVTNADLVLLMDADGQDDPSEIQNLLGRLDEGADLVTGRRQIRSDRFVKKHTSRLYNFSARKVLGLEGKDFNSGFKLMKGSVARVLDPYGEVHRYLQALASDLGYLSVEVNVNHRNRFAGSSKFGISRFWRGFVDLLSIWFMTKYRFRPMHLAAKIAVPTIAVGTILLIWMLVEWFGGNGVGSRPALLLGFFAVVTGLNLLFIGLLSELLVRSTRRLELVERHELRVVESSTIEIPTA